MDPGFVQVPGQVRDALGEVSAVLWIFEHSVGRGIAEEILGDKETAAIIAHTVSDQRDGVDVGSQ